MLEDSHQEGEASRASEGRLLQELDPGKMVQ